MDALTRRHRNSNPSAVAAAIPFPGSLEDYGAPGKFALMSKLAALRAAVLVSGFYFLLRLLLILKAWNY